MSLFNNTIETLEKEGTVHELYRFQGGRSNCCFDPETSEFVDMPSYIYLSKSLDHHKYFAVKRIKQLLTESVLSETKYDITTKDLRNLSTYRTIRRMVLNSELIPHLDSIKLVCDTSFIGLIRENSFNNNNKHNAKPIVERVDHNRYGGGYGLASEWKQLLYYLSYFFATRSITREDIVEMLLNMRRKGKPGSKNSLDFLFEHPEESKIVINCFLDSDFTKYKITECLEQIIDKGLVKTDSILAKKPSSTIKDVVSTYENNKSKILIAFDKHGKM